MEKKTGSNLNNRKLTTGNTSTKERHIRPTFLEWHGITCNCFKTTIHNSQSKINQYILSIIYSETVVSRIEGQFSSPKYIWILQDITTSGAKYHFDTAMIPSLSPKQIRSTETERTYAYRVKANDIVAISSETD